MRLNCTSQSVLWAVRRMQVQKQRLLKKEGAHKHLNADKKSKKMNSGHCPLVLTALGSTMMFERFVLME